MAEWTKEKLELQPHHLWRVKPGYKIFVADRGAVRFDIPDSWVIAPRESSIRFHDKPPPDDDCTLELTVMHLPPADWSQLPLHGLFEHLLSGERRSVLEQGAVVDVPRNDLELSWAEVRFLDASQSREAFSRIALGRAGNIQTVITLDFWVSDAARVVPAWDELVRSLRIGAYIGDPTLGDRGHD